MKTLDVKTIGKAKVIVDIVQKGNPEIRPAYKMKPRDVVIHNTGNAGRGANAEMHNRYIHNLASYHPKDTVHVSWHLSVDDKNIYQHLPFDETAWHTGDGSGANSGNMNGIGIEICENPDMNYAQAEENAIALAVYLMKKFNIGINNVKPHQFYSGKYCPRVILNRDGSFTPFRNRINAAYKGGTVTTSKPSSNATASTTANASYVGKRIESIHKGKDGVNYYNKPSFNIKDRVGVLPFGIGFPKVLGKVKVGSGEMYKVQNSNGAVFYVTDRTDLVKVVGVTTASKPASKPVTKPVAKPKPSTGIKAVGKIKVNKVNNFTYIYEKTSDKSKKLGQAKKNTTYSIAGSVPNWYEVIYNGKRAYIKAKYASRV